MMNNRSRFNTFERKVVPEVTNYRKEIQRIYSPSSQDLRMAVDSLNGTFATKHQTVHSLKTTFREISSKNNNQTVLKNKNKLDRVECKNLKSNHGSEHKLRSNRNSEMVYYDIKNDRLLENKKTDTQQKSKSEINANQIFKTHHLMREEHRTMSNNTSRDSNHRLCDNLQKIVRKRLSIDIQPVILKEKEEHEKETISERPDQKCIGKMNYLCGSTKSKLELCDFVNHDIIGGDQVWITSFGPTKLTYLDYVASGRALKCIENYIRYHVMPFYANTHTEISHFAAQTTRFREEARSIIRESVHANEDDAVIFCGSGSTTTVHKVIHALDMHRSLYTIQPFVFIGPYEHHSNILPWIEAKAKVIRIQQSQNGHIDVVHLEQELKEAVKGPKRLLIGSFSAASNVTGILTDTITISKLMHKYKGFALFDYACAAPYVEIDMNCTDQGPLAYKDAVFISTHKFLGGPQTPGILIAKRSLFRNQVPHGAGGGTVVFVRRHSHKYHKETEHREEGGTPGVIESIRAGLVFKLKETFTSTFIMGRETLMLQRAIAAWSTHPNLLILGDLSVERLPIFSMLFRNRETGRFLHHDFVALLLNDLFGLQVRSGCACAALYGLDLLGITENVAEKYEQLITECDTISKERDPMKNVLNEVTTDNVIFKPGFLRLNFPFFLPENCFNFVIKAVLMTAELGWRLLPLYDFNRQTGKWWYKNNSVNQPLKSLSEMTFTKGSVNLSISRDLKLERSHEKHEKSTSPNLFMQGSMPGLFYEEILERARYVFEGTNQQEQFLGDQSPVYNEATQKLRWFMLPSEAIDIINGKKVTYIAPEDLPFLPVALSKKLETQSQSST